MKVIENKGDYYLGLDVGTSSVGWAVTDSNYKLKRFKGKDMWGARLFDEASDASERRTNREARRRLARRKTRLLLLEELFQDEINKTDPNFFIRMHESSLYPEDKTDKTCRFSLFNDHDFTDDDYLTKYPTIYHLESELIHDDRPHDVRLVFLALHSLLKSRGHFLYENTGDTGIRKLDDALDDLNSILSTYDLEFHPADREQFDAALTAETTITVKKKELKKAYGKIEGSESPMVDLSLLIDLLAGASVDLSKMFPGINKEDLDSSKISLDQDLDSLMDNLSAVLQDRIDILSCAKDAFDIARLSLMLGSFSYICDAKAAQYNENRKELTAFKRWVKTNCRDHYREIFHKYSDSSEKKEKPVNNFAAYMSNEQDISCSQENFCKYLRSLDCLKPMKEDTDSLISGIYRKIEENTFFPRLRTSVNRFVPYQLELKEVTAILKNAEGYLPFLKVKDENGLTVSDKVISTFKFKIPYYVGPLGRNAANGWAVRTNEKIYPWNFEKVVDTQKSAAAFMDKLVGRCTYTYDRALPANSLLYSKFEVLNEINPLKIDNEPISVELKQKIYDDLFLHSRKKVTKKSITKYFLANGFITDGQQVSGVDDQIKSTLKPYHDFEVILSRTHDEKMVEELIEGATVFGADTVMLKKWLQQNYGDRLNAGDIRHICKLNYKDWGRLSKTFLHDIFSENEDGEVFSVIDCLWNTNHNLMQLMSNDYQFAENARQYRIEHYGISDNIQDRLEEMYIAPAVKRSIWQTYRIVEEISHIEKSVPAKIFIEMARTNSKEMKNKRTESRKNRLLKLYESCKNDFPELYDSLQKETDESLRRDKLYLYYTQFGKCMYSGEPIDLTAALANNKTYDIDHIFPRSRIKDDSLDNRVLVQADLNHDKGNNYPIKSDIQTRMHSFWTMLHNRNLISDKKYSRLTRTTGLTIEELSSFVARQLTETQQSTLALARVLQKIFPDTKIVYSKAGNVHDFRQTPSTKEKFKDIHFPKFRDVNDLHHAKDAYLNIVVGNVYDTKFTSQFFKDIVHQNYSLNKVFDYDTPNAWKADGTSLSTVQKVMTRNTPIITYMEHVQKGALFDVNPLKKGLGQHPLKKDKPIDKYGGYKNKTGTYFAVVEHTGKKTERVRDIVPVYLMDVKDYERNPEEYCKEVLHLKEPTIIVKRLLVNSIVEADGKRVLISSRTNSRLNVCQTYQLAIDDAHAQYLKECAKYIDRCTLQKKEIPLSDHSILARDKNLNMFRWFQEKLKTSVYANALSAIAKIIENKENEFIRLTVLEQCKVLMQVLAAFQCNVLPSDLSLMGGGKTAGKLTISMRISSCRSFYLIRQSVTGLYETKINLLK